MKKIQIINGPNLNLLGKREPTVYGNASFEGYLSELRAKYPQCEIAYFQSNVEGEMINKIHEVGFDYDGIIMNAGAYTHTSIALHDAIKAVTTPVVGLAVFKIVNCQLSIVNFKKGLYVKAYEDCCYSFRPAL